MSTAQTLAAWMFTESETQTLVTFVRADGEYLKAGCRRDPDGRWLPILDGDDAGLGSFDNLHLAADAIVEAYCGQRAFGFTDAIREIFRAVPACDDCRDGGYVGTGPSRSRHCQCEVGRRHFKNYLEARFRD